MRGAWVEGFHHHRESGANDGARRACQIRSVTLSRHTPRTASPPRALLSHLIPREHVSDVVPAGRVARERAVGLNRVCAVLAHHPSHRRGARPAIEPDDERHLLRRSVRERRRLGRRVAHEPARARGGSVVLRARSRTDGTRRRSGLHVPRVNTQYSPDDLTTQLRAF